MPSTDLNRHARQVINVTQGHPQGCDPSIVRSWQRCLEDYHLDPAQNIAPTVLEHSRILEGRERLQQVLHIAGCEMNSLHQQLSGAGHAVLLTDARGIILNCITAPAERKVFEHAGLWLGADWSEAREGTNGIGTCVIERQALSIYQDEHFRGRHTGLTCSASPVFDPQGELLAVLDVSSARHAATRQSQFHTMALVNLSAKTIESSYFLRQYEHQWLLRFHLQAQAVGLFSEGMLAFDGEGLICGVNQSGLNLLGQTRSGLLGQSIDNIFDCGLDDLFARASTQASASWPLRTCDGRQLFAALRGQPRAVPVCVAPAPVPKPIRPPMGDICMGDEALQQDFRRALRVFERDVPLLINGETGSGKEAFAKAVHQASLRASKPFDGGTLFLDEIGDMPLALQTRLLRVLEDRVVVPIGGEPQAVDVRIVSATHRNLLERVSDGSFREDLYYRLNGLEVGLPALRERTDKSQLLDFLLAQEAGEQRLAISPAARQALLEFQWPGNVRQLRNMLRTLAALCEGDVIEFDDLPVAIRQVVTEPAPSYSENPLENAEKLALLAALDTQRWHMTQTAAQLGVSRNTLYRKLRKHGIAR
ncbi:Fis family transcriptional regulator [Pseudomonas endophytica]|uniref:Fis family transcriptional regulator n=1 Tax=Pseudomonas endophytica TaxID=1563157 RepID=A0A0Q0T1U7_9PSED|nr:sigma-54-dependent Fis family transcriptional regulator [Pseudomonas endophytica]KQB53752.1 Fis family transcriptional regulator [Pseudomonas endophytica]